MEEINENDIIEFYEIVRFYENVWNLKQSILELGVLTPAEESLVEENPAIRVDAYQNVTRLIKQTLLDDKNVNIKEEPYNLMVTTKNMEGLELPIATVVNKSALKDTEIDIYQTEINRDKRQEYIEELYRYYLDLMHNCGDVSFVLKALDELRNRIKVSPNAKYELMSIQLDYRARILNALNVNPREYMSVVVPHFYPLGKSLTRKRMGTRLTDTYQIY